MEKKIIIILPKPDFNVEERNAKIRAMFSDDMKREGLLSKIMIFIHQGEPLSVTELQEDLQRYYGHEFHRFTISRLVDRLAKLRLLNVAASGEVLSMPEVEKESVHKQIENKHRLFLEKINPAFRSRFNHVKYLWVSNGDGLQFLEWCCKLNKFEYKEENDTNDKN